MYKESHYRSPPCRSHPRPRSSLSSSSRPRPAAPPSPPSTTTTTGRTSTSSSRYRARPDQFSIYRLSSTVTHHFSMNILHIVVLPYPHPPPIPGQILRAADRVHLRPARVRDQVHRAAAGPPPPRGDQASLNKPVPALRFPSQSPECPTPVLDSSDSLLNFRSVTSSCNMYAFFSFVFLFPLPLPNHSSPLMFSS